jgi:methionine-S-sulfoxide reductase
MEDLIRRQPGVLDTRVGYTGGENDYATYRNHPGHAEAVEIVFDPTQTSYRDILEFFFQIHDPSTLNRQGNDVGTSYRSAIFPTTPEQEREARETIADVDASGLWPGDVVTTIEPAGPFLPFPAAGLGVAEACHHGTLTAASEGACPVEAERAPSLDEWAALVTQCDHGSAGGEALDMRERHVDRRGHGGDIARGLRQ